jgi:hypothetical protein
MQLKRRGPEGVFDTFWQCTCQQEMPMKDLRSEHAGTADLVPVAEIVRTRRDFPAARISFCLEMICPGLDGAGALVRDLEDTGLTLKSLKVNENGAVRCILLDDARVDLVLLGRSLCRSADLIRWITQIDAPAAQ